MTSFPSDLTSRKQWLVWRFEQQPGDKKPRKVPYYADGRRRTGEQGSLEDRARLVTYLDAVDACDHGEYSGLGFAFLPGDGLIGVDIDGCFNTDDEIRKKRAASIIKKCASYTEYSPSKNGVHIILAGECETFKSNDVGLEVFCGRQFFTMTGDVHPESHDIIGAMTDDLLKRFRKVIAEAKEARKAQPSTTTPSARQTVDFAPTDAAKVESALAYINPDCGYDDWIKIGMAIHAELGSSAMSIWDWWSRKGGKYCGESALAAHWRSFEGGAGVTGGTLFKHAMDAGWRPPMPKQVNPPRQSNPKPIATADADDVIDIQPTTVTDTAAVDPNAVDVFSPLFDTNGKGKPLATMENMAEILRRINTTVRYNVISKQVEVLLPGAQFSIDNKSNASMAHIISWVNRFQMATGSVGEYVLALADQNPYNPVANWILSKPWDGQPRFNDLCATIREAAPRTLPDGRNMRDVVLMRWMISAVAAVFEPNGIVARGVLVLQGPQNIGKTHWLKRLAPKELDVIKDGITLNPSDKDSVMLCVSNWIVELGELDATFRKADIASLKSFLTLDRDKLRRPYDRTTSEFARRTVFFASVNPRQFLHDATGNSRFWTVECESIDHTHNIDMQQVWAEIYALYRQGIGWYLEADEFAALNDHNEDYTSSDPVHDMIDSGYDWASDPGRWVFRMNATEICLTAGIQRPTKADTNSASSYVVSKYKVKTVKVKGYKQWLMPPKLFKYDNAPPDPAHPGYSDY